MIYNMYGFLKKIQNLLTSLRREVNRMTIFEFISATVVKAYFSFLLFFNYPSLKFRDLNYIWKKEYIFIES